MKMKKLFIRLQYILHLKPSLMFKNYFKTAWRILVNNKIYSILNILGLATGMAVAMLISLWIWDEVSYNSYHANHKQIAQIVSTFTDQDNKMETALDACAPIGDELRNKYGSDFKNVSMASYNTSHVIAVGNQKIMASGMWVEPNFPSMFSLRILTGNINALNDPSSVLISSSLAKILFGNENAMNKVIRLENEDSYNVAGVYDDFPNNSTFHEARVLLSWKKFVIEKWPRFSHAATNWNFAAFQSFVQVADHIDMLQESEKIKNIVMAHKNAATDEKEQASLYPMDKWRLYSEFKNGIPTTGRIQYVWLFSLIGVFVLLLACINFMNLSTARSAKRAKEVGIRKTMGSLRSQLINQFLSESVLVAFASFICSLMIIVLLLPLFNKLSEKNIGLPTFSLLFWTIAIAFTILTGIISGSYPALYLSQFKPVKVLKGTFHTGRLASLPRKVLVVVQFTFSIALMIGTIIVFKQIQFAKNRAVNYKKEGLLAITFTNSGIGRPFDAIREDLLATGAVSNMATSSTPVTEVWHTLTGFNWQGKAPNALPVFGTLYVSLDYGRTINWKIKEGRDFSRDFSTDSLSVILNEAAVNLIGMKKNIVGQSIQFNDKNYMVIGVVKNMIMESPYKAIRPSVFFCSHASINVVLVGIKPGHPVKDALSKIEAVFKKYDPGAPLSYTFVDEDYARKFDDEKRVEDLATFFTILAIFISCLGLFGLASFVAEQRTKEIGVRKILGASVYDVWNMLSKEFTLLVFIASFIAIPLAWYFLNKWLQQYDYRTGISFWVFIFSGLGALIITLITISFQAIKAAIANPVKSLRTE